MNSGHFYSASSSPLVLRHATDTARILCRSLHAKAPQAIGSEGPYVADRAGFEPTTLWTEGVESTNAPPRPAT